MKQLLRDTDWALGGRYSPDFARIIEHAPNLIYVFNHIEGSNSYTNRSLFHLLGYSDKEIKDFGSSMMEKIIHPDDFDRVMGYLGTIRALKDDEIGVLAYRVRYKTGGWKWLYSQDTVFARDLDGKVTHHIGAATDITAQKQAEANALQAEAIATATNEELMQFSYAMSHDMKAPSNTLQLILSELRLSIGDAATEDTKELLGLAEETIFRMQTVVDSTLEYGNMVGTTTPPAPVDLAKVLTSVRSVLRAKIRETGASVTIDPMPVVLGIEAQLHTLFQNLLENALKFHKHGVAPRISISASEPSANGRSTIDVKDHGVGIPRQRQSEIFLLFKRLNTEAAQAGSGIGLATCRRVAVNHKTQLTLVSQPGQGATFSIALDTI